MYVCGMTVYDYCHLGMRGCWWCSTWCAAGCARAAIASTYVRNITDIDDKIIRRAQENREPIDALTGRFIRAMDEDCAALGVEKPDHEPRATGYVAEMKEIISILEKMGLAYHAGAET